MNDKAKIAIRELSTATSVSGQGVGSAYLEMVALCKEQDDLLKILEKGDKGKAQIYHIHTVNPTFRMRMNKKHVNVVYVHFLPTTLDGSLKMPKPIFAIFKAYVRSFYRKADEIVVVNPIFTKPLIELGVREENITFIPNYVGHEKFKPLGEARKKELRQEFGVKDTFTVLGCGQVQTRKGVLDFIKVAEQNPDMSFIWAGGFSFGRMTDGYEELKKIMDNPPANVKFLGIVERQRMNDVYNLADVFFMPSFDELMPMSMLEAVNVHLPVLVRDLELYKDIFFDHLLPETTVEGWSSELRKLRDDKEYYGVYVEHAKALADFYSKERVAQAWREYYPRILKKWAANPKKKIDFKG